MRHTRLLLILALAGCTGYDLVALDAGRSTHAVVEVESYQADSMEVRVLAEFQRGTDSTGRLVTLTEAAIRVDGHRIAPEAPVAITPIYWRFDWRSGRMDSTSAGSVVVDLPPLEDAPGTGITLAIGYPTRSGAHAANLPVTGDLRLPISAPEFRPVLESRSAFWSTYIGDSCRGGTRHHHVASGTGWFPDDVWVPRSIIDGMGSTDFAVCFQFGMAYPLDGAPYPVHVRSTSLIEWRVRR